jgi:hypothetical protein
MATEQQHFDVARSYQAHYDEVLRQVGMRAPQPTLGQTVNDYRRETLRMIKRALLPQNHELYRVNYRGLPADALKGFEPQLLQAAVVEANNPMNVPKGELRELPKTNPHNGYKEHHFVGQDSFVRLPGFGTNIPFAGGHRDGRYTTLRQIQQSADKFRGAALYAR